MFFPFFLLVTGEIFAVFFTPFPEEETSDYIEHGPIIRVCTVGKPVYIGHCPCSVIMIDDSDMGCWKDWFRIFLLLAQMTSEST